MRKPTKIKPKKEGIIDVLLNIGYRSNVKIIVGLNDGHRVLLEHYKIDKDRVCNFYWTRAASNKKDRILFKDIKELILAGV